MFVETIDSFQKDSEQAARGRAGTTRLLPVAMAMCVGLSLSACSSDERVATHPVHGRVLVADQPAAGAFLVFHPTGAPTSGEIARPAAQVRPDGSFDLSTFDEADGAPAGDYAVTVEWRKLVTRAGESTPGPNIVPGIYSRPETTPLKVSVLADQDNTLTDFQIKTRR